MCAIRCLALGERLGVTLVNATPLLLEVIIVDASTKLIVVML